MKKADIGDLVRSTCTFKSRATEAVADPTAISVTVTNPAGTAVTVTYGGSGSGQVSAISKTSTGIYYVEITINAAGDWTSKWLGTGDVVAGTPVDVINVKD